MSSALKTAVSKAASPARLATRSLRRPSVWPSAAPPPRRNLSSAHRGPAAAEGDEQAQPLGLYYEILLGDPPHYAHTKPGQPSPPAAGAPQQTSSDGAATSSAAAAATPAPADGESKAKIVFGRSLAGPAERAERLEAVRSRSVLVAGVLVPPKPEEPDNCCMSGCVNCVWDRFREEMEEWATASAAAEARLLAKKQQQDGVGGEADERAGASRQAKSRGAEPAASSPGAASMDDDGGGSDTNWATPEKSPKIAKDLWDDELWQNVPVGIREFMKQEKKLKEKHKREGTSGG